MVGGCVSSSGRYPIYAMMAKADRCFNDCSSFCCLLSTHSLLTRGWFSGRARQTRFDGLLGKTTMTSQGAIAVGGDTHVCLQGRSRLRRHLSCCQAQPQHQASGSLSFEACVQRVTACSGCGCYVCFVVKHAHNILVFYPVLQNCSSSSGRPGTLGISRIPGGYLGYTIFPCGNLP